MAPSIRGTRCLTLASRASEPSTPSTASAANSQARARFQFRSAIARQREQSEHSAAGGEQVDQPGEDLSRASLDASWRSMLAFRSSRGHERLRAVSGPKLAGALRRWDVMNMIEDVSAEPECAFARAGPQLLADRARRPRRADRRRRPIISGWRGRRCSKATIADPADRLGFRHPNRPRSATRTTARPATLGPFLSWLAKNRPGLRIHILKWDIGAIKLLGRGTTIFRLARWAWSKRIYFKLDGAHPSGAQPPSEDRGDRRQARFLRRHRHDRVALGHARRMRDRDERRGGRPPGAATAPGTTPPWR